jgi:hypothetical protein
VGISPGAALGHEIRRHLTPAALTFPDAGDRIEGFSP